MHARCALVQQALALVILAGHDIPKRPRLPSRALICLVEVIEELGVPSEPIYGSEERRSDKNTHS